jgi:hypothetical protein
MTMVVIIIYDRDTLLILLPPLLLLPRTLKVVVAKTGILKN